MDISSNIDEVTHLRRLVETDDPSFFGFKKLRVRGRDLHELPVAIFSLLELEVLSLSPDREASLYYRLYFLPKQIGQLINLRILILDTNALTNLPPEISNLSHLEILTLSNNYLTSLPPQFHRLNELQSLHLANNSFSVFPPQICILKNLQFLDLSDNKISELPHSISQLHSLQTLLLFRNRLHVLPDTLCDLTELRCLWLGENCLTNLPRCFGKLDKLDWSFIYTSAVLDGNPMERPPMDICRQALKWYKMAFSRSLSMSLILLYIAFCFLDPVADSREMKIYWRNVSK
ncbi:leucine-rich repeat-containing protein 57 isoform X2 [Octopus bimaculoides]|uniref:leucine-rich repeat-containing protein 57 isoform X2 n=1 Tax=Octopus bimaculoides TaxID=37653 RepID=UPI0022E0982A|nr:leucine-rich repeat-containing protein 57 isoform X2 [Octopus bimaculoides]